VAKYLLQLFPFFKRLTANFVSDFFSEWWMVFLCCRKKRRCGVKNPTTRVRGGSAVLCPPAFCSTSGRQGNPQMDLVFDKFKGTYIVEEKFMLFGT
jgi:hypothetical protein